MRLTTVLSAAFALLLPAIAAADAPAKNPIAAILAVPTPVCKTASEAYNATRDAFKSFKNCQLYMMASIINDDPTHTELQEAAKWAIKQVPAAIKKASDLNDPDPKWARKEFIKAKLAFLKFEIKIANQMLTKGLPKEPWLGKAFNWAAAVWPKLRDLWETITGHHPPPSDPKNPKKPDPPIDPQAIMDKIDKKLAEIDRQLYELVNAECRMG